MNQPKKNSLKLPALSGQLRSSQISFLLMRELKSGVFSKSQKLPSELELADMLNVSRTAIRDALSDIEREGFIERVRGIGTVINRNIVNIKNRLDLKLEYNELIVDAGYHPSTDNVEVFLDKADEHLAEKINIDIGSDILVVKKRICAGNIPVIYSIDHIPHELLVGVSDYMDIDWGQPIFNILENYCGLYVITGITKVSATNGDVSVRKKLELNSEDALLMLDEVGYYKMGHPIIHSYQFFTDFFDFTMLRKKF